MTFLLEPTGPLRRPEVVVAPDQAVAEGLVSLGVRAAAPPAAGWSKLASAGIVDLAAEADGSRLVLALASVETTALVRLLAAAGAFPLGLPDGTDIDDAMAIIAALDGGHLRPLGWTPLPNAAGSIDDLLAGIAVRGQVPAVSTRLATLDLFLPGGWVPGLYLLGGMPGCGKTGFGLFQAIGAAQVGIPVLFVSADQGVPELLARLVCAEAGVPIGAWWKLEAADPLLADLAEAAARLPLDRLHFVDDLGPAGVSGLPALVKRLAAQTGTAPFVVVDYLQVLRPAKSEDAGEERVRIANAGDQLRKLVRSSGLRLLALSSTNRASYHEDPGLEALKGSGDLEFSADAVFLLRDDDSGEEDGADDDLFVHHVGEPFPPLPLEFHFLKNRFGPRTAADRPILLRFDTRRGSFSDRGIAPPRAKRSRGSSGSASPRDPSPEEVARLCAGAGGWSSIDEARKALGLSRDRAKTAVDAAIDIGSIIDEGSGKRPRWRVSSSWRDGDSVL